MSLTEGVVKSDVAPLRADTFRSRSKSGLSLTSGVVKSDVAPLRGAVSYRLVSLWSFPRVESIGGPLELDFGGNPRVRTKVSAL